MSKKDYLEGAINHFKHQEIKIIEVEEWGLTGEDAIYVKPFTLLEKAEIFKGSNDNDLTVLIDVIVKKAETKDGEKMFDLDSKVKMKKFVDPDIIGKVASQILNNSNDNLQALKKINSDNHFRFHFFLAEQLHKTIGEILSMPVEEFNLWIAYYEVKHDDQQKALNKQKMQGKKKIMSTKRLNIDILAKDRSRQALKQVQGNLEQTKKSVLNLKNALIGLGVGAVLKSFVDVGKEAESLQIRFKFLFGSVEEGATALNNLTKFASKVPFSLDQISRASGNLAVVAKDADDLNRILEITGNVASVTGLDFETTATQIQRSFSGGIASADIFRERGVRALLGFKAGATVTAEETAKRFEELFAGDGEFASATKDLAQTLEGTLSMLGDKYFKFQKDVASGFFDELKSEFESLDNFLADYENEISDIGKGLGGILAQSIRTVGTAVRFVNDNIEIFKALGLGALAFGATKAFISLGTALATATTNLISFNAIFSKNFIGVLVAGGVALAKFSGLLDEVFAQEGEDDIQNYTSRLATLNIQLLGVKDTLQKTNSKDLLTDFQKISEAGNLIIKNIEPLKDEVRKDITGLQELQSIITNMGKEGIKVDQEFFDNPLIQKYGIKTLEDFQDAIILAEADLLNLDQQTARFIETLRNIPFGEIQIGFEEMKDSFKELREAIKSFDKGFQDAMTKAIETNDDFEKLGSKAFDGFADTLTDALITGKANFKDFARSLLADLLRIIIRQRVALALQRALGFVGGGTGASAGSGNFISNLFGGFFANGGRPPINRPSIVGERGAELFVPDTAGTIIPNNEVKGMGGTTNINFTINTVDARGVDELLTSRRNTIVNVINDALNRQGKEALV